MEKLKNFFNDILLLNISAKKKQQFLNEVHFINISRFRIMAPVVVFIFLVLLGVDVHHYFEHMWRLNTGYKLLFISHIVVIIFLLFIYLLTFLKPVELPDHITGFHVRLIHVALFAGLIIMAVISIADVYINGSVVAFVGALFGFTSIFLMGVHFSIILLLASSGVLVIFLMYCQSVNGVNYQVQLINIISFTIVAFILTRIIFHYQYKDFSNRVIIQDQKERLKEMAMKDPLTSLFNRRIFEELGYLELARVKRYSGDLSILIFDLDHFKKINDEYGHPVGDSVLIEIASLVANNIRETDIFIRWGGEEFVIISPGTNSDGMNILSEKIRKLIDEYKSSENPSVTVSVGYTSYQNNDQLNDMIKRADNALYCAKTEGRNCVRSGDA